MYIELKNTDRTDEIIQDFLRINVAIDVRKYDFISFLKANLSDYGYAAYCRINSKVLVVISKETLEDEIVIPLEEIETIYDL